MHYSSLHVFSFFFFNDTATTEIYTLSLHDALPIFRAERDEGPLVGLRAAVPRRGKDGNQAAIEKNLEPLRDALVRSEEHTSELQSRRDLVCRLLLEKKNKQQKEEE